MESSYSTELWLCHTDEPHPDSELQSRIWDVLHARHICDGGGLHVYVEDRVVTLAGHVEDVHEALDVVQVVTSFRDVAGLVNDLHIGPEVAA